MWMYNRARERIIPQPNPTPLQGEARKAALLQTQAKKNHLAEAILTRNTARRLTLGGLAINALNTFFTPYAIGAVTLTEAGSQLLTQHNIPYVEFFGGAAVGLACLSVGLVAGTAREGWKWYRKSRDVKQTAQQLKDLEWQLGVEKSDILKRYDETRISTGLSNLRYVAIGIGIVGSFIGAAGGGVVGGVGGAGVGAIPGIVFGGIGGFLAGNSAVHMVERALHYGTGHRLAKESRKIRKEVKRQRQGQRAHH